MTTKVATTTGPYLAGSNVVYQLSVTNNGPDAATTVSLTDPCPTGTTYVSDSPSSGTYTSASGSWDVASIANAGSETLDLTCEIDATTTSGIVTNTTTAANSTENDPSTVGDDLDEDISIDATADLVTTKVATSAGPYVVGDQVVYQLTVTNNGPDAATTVSLTDPCPTGTTFVSDVASSGTYTAGTGAWACLLYTSPSPRDRG